MTKRRPISQLPAVNRTETLKRFFGTTVDHLFQPGQTASISGFIGRVPEYNNPEVDFYKAEPNQARTKFQLESTMVSTNEDGVNAMLFYDDLIARLSADGALVSDPNRLFQSEFWSWAPPTDIDKINNFQRYYWSGDDTPAIVLTLPGMDIPTVYKSDGKTTKYKLPAQQPCWNILDTDKLPAIVAGDEFYPGCPMVLLDGVRYTDFTVVNNDEIRFNSPIRKGGIIEAYRYGNIGDGARTTFSIPSILTEGVTHTNSDVRVYLNGRETSAFTISGETVVMNVPVPANMLVTVTLFDSLNKVISGRPYFNIEKITHQPVKELINGLRIQLLDPYTVFYGFDSEPNATFKWDDMRPNIFMVDGVGVAIHLTDLESSLRGLEPQYVVIARDDPAQSYFSRINRWVQSDALAWFNGNTVSRQAKRPICEHLPGLAIYNYGRTRAPTADIVYGVLGDYSPTSDGSDDYGRIPASGDFVMFGEVGDPAKNNKFFIWVGADDFAESTDPIMTPLADAKEGDVFRHMGTDDEFRLLGGVWLKCDAPGVFPLFDLFDNDGISLGDKGFYPESNFAGSRIFNYKLGAGVNDPLLGFPVDHDTYGAILFENDLYTHSYSYRDGDMTGFYYYLVGENNFGNEWYKSTGVLPSTGTKNVVVPLNLQANPNYDTPQYISRNTWFEHFSSIAANQVDFSGKPYTKNNWQYTQRDLSKGTTIIQSRSPLLKLMLLMNDPRFDLKKAIKFSETEYTRFKLKVAQKIREKLKAGLLVPEMYDDAEIVKILNSIAASRTPEFAFALSKIGDGGFFIPMTPATLGITAMVEPHMVVEHGMKFIVGHDGSKIASLDPLTDRLMMALEMRIFNSRKDEVYLPADRPMIDEFDLFSGKYRSGAYSRDESNIVQQASFEDWARLNNIDYQTNTTFDITNPFTWNYGSIGDRDGDVIPGNWRGIYRWYFDTEMPNTTPWEMLGFAEMPAWWTSQYGAAPYTRLNTALWNDLERGFIAAGDRAGIDHRFIRPGLMSVLPVDDAGNLLDPVQARIIESSPPIQFAQESWVFGDNSPVENLWRRSSSFGFAKAIALFLMRPAQFVEYFWDRDNKALVHKTQWIDITTNDRASSSELVVHGEYLPDGTQYVSYGVQAWLVDYMIQHGQTATILGELVRGLDVRLAHKMAGFTTRDRLHVDAESFGRIPDEDITIEMYQSPGVAADFYSGVVIEHMGPSRWRVIGYNSIDPYFAIQPSDRNGRKIALTGGDDRVINPWTPNVYYKVGMFVSFNGYVYETIKNHQSMSSFEPLYWRQDETGIYADERLYKFEDALAGTLRIPYTTVMHSRQDMVDFLYSYQRSLEAKGFGFDEGTWDEAVEKYINWSKVRWSGGTFLTLSPGARSITYQSPQGFVLNLEGSDSTGTIVNRTGHLIDYSKTQIDRYDDTITITATGDDIYGIALRKGEIEHALIFSNRTIFGDIIYDTTFNVRQDRLKLIARRTEDWTGRYDAPGFVISQGQIVSNFDKSAEDIRYMFDIERADNTALRDHARHTIGFENRSYLSDLLLNETQQFELYQGMIQQKGAPGAFNKVLRSRAVEGNRGLQFMEEWAFRVSEYGAFEPRGYMELVLGQSDLRRQNQIVRFGDKLTNPAGMLTVPPTDPRWVSPSRDFSGIITDGAKAMSLPNAGYVRTTEATYMAPNIDLFNNQAIALIKNGDAFKQGESVWLYNGDVSGRWAIKYLVSEPNTVKVENNDTNPDVVGTRFTLAAPHNISIDETVLIAGPVNNNYDLTGMFTVSDVGDNWFEIDSGDDIGQTFDFTAADEVGPAIFTFVDGRFRVLNEVVDFPLDDVLVYVDNIQATVFDPMADPSVARWGVLYSNDAKVNDPVVYRAQPEQIDNSKIASSLIYDQKTTISDTGIAPQPITVAQITPIDPMLGLIAGEADKEIDYKLEYDPAEYGEDQTMWTDDFIGRLWWDMSTTWFVNPYTDTLHDFSDASAYALNLGDGDTLYDTASDQYLLAPTTPRNRYLEELQYRAASWAKLAPGSTVDVYEWTKSYVAPNDAGVDLHPNGDYVQTVEYLGALGKPVTVYYFWVKNPTSIPANNIGRTLDAKSCSTLIVDPTASNIPWMAAITPNEMIISGVTNYLTDDTSVLQIQLQLTNDDEAKPHKQWMMLRPTDEKSQPTLDMWKKLRDSLVGFDDNLVSIPRQKLHIAAKTGFEVGQSMFDVQKRALARSSLVTMINYQLARRNISAMQLFGANSLDYNTPLQEYLVWSRNDDRTVAVLPPEALYSRDESGFALRTSDPAEMNEWLNDDQYVYRRVLLDNRFAENPSWSVWEKNGTGANRVISIAKHYHHSVSDIADLQALVATGSVTNNQFILVEHNAAFDGFWTIHDHTGKVVEAQTYRTADFWEYDDWYADGFDASNPPIVSYATSADRNKHENPSPTNLFVKIMDNGSGYWQWTAYLGGQWTVVAQQLGTIQLSDRFYTKSIVYGWNATDETYDFDGSKVIERDGSHELRVMFDAILNNRVITDVEQNELWFSMVNFVHAHHDQVDWAFKTSFLTLVGLNEALGQPAVTKPDNTPAILSYVDEVKPYHVTLREYTRNYAITDIANTTVTDFDKPSYYDVNDLVYRRLDETSPTDLAIIQTGAWNNWYQNMGLARKFKVTMKLDRIWFKTGEATPGAAERIMSYYQPSTGMKPKDLNKLLDLDYRGTVLDGMDFNTIDASFKTVQGGLVSDNVDINGEHDGKRGLQMRDPRVSPDTPEDLVRLGAHDVILIRAKDKWGSGAPRTVIKTYDVSNETSATIEFPIGMVARNVLVFFDGLRGIENTSFTVDYLANKVTVPLQRENGTRIQTVTIHAFGFAGHTTIIDQTLYVANATGSVSIDVPSNVASEQFVAEVTIGGQVVSSAITSGKVKFSAKKNDGAIITYYKGDVCASTSFKEIKLPDSSNGIYDLTAILSNEVLTLDSTAIMVEKNGLRLAPPLTVYSDKVTSKRITPNVNPLDVIIVDDTGNRSTVKAVDIAAYEEVDFVLADNIPDRYVLWNDIIVFRDSDADKRTYTIIVDRTGDYSIDGDGVLTINSVKTTDDIRVLLWRNDAVMLPRTWSFDANPTGVYKMFTRARKGSSWLTIAGRRLVEDVDYSIQPTVAGAWDGDAYEDFWWDDLTEVEITIKNVLKGHENDNIVITTFEGRQNTSAMEWQHTTLTPDIVRFRFNTEPVEGERPYFREDTAWATHSHDPYREGGATVDVVEIGTGSFDIQTNPLNVPAILLAEEAIPVPDAKANVPGVVWVGAERIEYFKRKKKANGVITLDQVRRGTKGTPRMAHGAGTLVRVEHALRGIPAAPRGDITPVPPADPSDTPGTRVEAPAVLITPSDPLFE